MVHGVTRLTEDLEVVYRRTPDNIDRLALALSPHQPYLRGAPPNLPFRWDSRTIERGLNFTLDTTLGQIGLLGEIPGAGAYDQLLPYSVEAEIIDMRCLVTGFERLIHAKRIRPSKGFGHHRRTGNASGSPFNIR